jgi:glycosyltransferase involved in cell wall biosynthesis
MKTINYSYRVGDEKNILDETHNIVFGKAHYSYKVAARKYLSLMEHIGYGVREIIRPEIYKHSVSFSHIKNYDLGDTNYHFIFKPIEHFNVLKSAFNIGVFAWEFDAIVDFDIDGSPFKNQKRMLSMLDEIWVPSNYTKNVLNKIGFDNVRFVPAPILIPKNIDNKSMSDLIGNVDSVKLNAAAVNIEEILPLNENVDFTSISKTYIAVINPWDYRKNLIGLLATFSEFCYKYPDVLLVIKVIIDNKTTLLKHINEILYSNLSVRGLRSDNIVFISEFLKENEMYSLLKSADFYYNMSFAEGQFLPILEAMSVGTVAISPDSTAMADYINSANSFVVDSKLVKCDSRSNAFHGIEFNWFEPDLKMAVEQLESSYAVSKSVYKRKSKKAIATVKKVYGSETISRVLKDALND